MYDLNGKELCGERVIVEHTKGPRRDGGYGGRSKYPGRCCFCFILIMSLLRDFIHYREPKFLGHKISSLSLVADVHSIHIVIIMVETVRSDALIKVDRLEFFCNICYSRCNPELGDVVIVDKMLILL